MLFTPWLSGVSPDEPWFRGDLWSPLFPCPASTRLGQVVVPGFASLLQSVSPSLFDPTSVVSQVGTGPVEPSVGSSLPPAPVSGVPPRPIPTQLAVPRDTFPAVSGWDQAGQAGPQVPTRRRLLDHHPAFAPLLSAFSPQPDRVAPDDRDHSRRPSRSCPPSVPGGGIPSERGMDVKDCDRPRDSWVPPVGLLPCELLCP
jgi:hypothetical protein